MEDPPPGDPQEGRVRARLALSQNGYGPDPSGVTRRVRSFVRSFCSLPSSCSRKVGVASRVPSRIWLRQGIYPMNVVSWGKSLGGTPKRPPREFPHERAFVGETPWWSQMWPHKSLEFSEAPLVVRKKRLRQDPQDTKNKEFAEAPILTGKMRLRQDPQATQSFEVHASPRESK